METKEFLKYIVEEIHTTIVAELYHYYRDSVCHRAGTLSALW